jgi:hypothetical protein
MKLEGKDLARHGKQRTLRLTWKSGMRWKKPEDNVMILFYIKLVPDILNLVAVPRSVPFGQVHSRVELLAGCCFCERPVIPCVALNQKSVGNRHGSLLIIGLRLVVSTEITTCALVRVGRFLCSQDTLNIKASARPFYINIPKD